MKGNGKKLDEINKSEKMKWGEIHKRDERD